MTDLPDNADIPVLCPTCGHETTELLKQLMEDPSVNCPQCKKSIKLSRDDLKKTIKAARDKFADLQ